MGAVRWLEHVLGVGLLVASVTLYVITIGLALVGGMLYLARGGTRGAWRWAVDVGATLAVVTLFSRHTVYRPLPPLDEYPGRTVDLFGEVAWVFADSLWAPVSPSTTVVVAVWATLAIVVAAAWRHAARSAAGDPLAADLRRWVLLAAGAAVAAVAAYVVFVPSGYLSPRAPGQLNRVNVAGGIALVVLLYAALMAAALLVTSALPWGARGAGALVSAAAVLIAAGNIVQVRRDQRLWERSAVLQHHIVRTVTDAIGPVPRGALIITYASQYYTGDEIPVFAYPWDLSAALAVHYDDDSVRAYPALGRPRLSCERTGVTIVRTAEPFPPASASYGRAYLVAVASRQATRITDAGACRTASDALAGT
jgi:hypothetical protein